MTKNVGNLLGIAAFAVLFVLCASFASIRVLGYSTFIVTGGSMEPAIHKGALVLVEPVAPSTVNIGDVITFQQYGQTTTHRVVAIAQSPAGPLFKTKGDANTVADPEDKTFAGQVGVVRVAVPLAGYAVFGVQAYWRLALALIAAVLFFGCAAALVFDRKQRVRVMRPALLVTRRAAVMVTVDTDDAWHAHLEWLARSQLRRQRMA